MSNEDIDPETGLLDVISMLPKAGDSVLIVNCGEYFEIQRHSWSCSEFPPLHLTDNDIERLRQGSIIWN